MSDLLFVYGTLRSDIDRSRLPPAARRAADDLTASAELIARGAMAGTLRAVAWYPALIVADRLPDPVYGEVWRLADPLTALPRLDAYEGGEYHREVRDVAASDGAILSAWVYVYDAPVGDAPVIDSGDYAHWIAQQTP